VAYILCIAKTVTNSVTLSLICTLKSWCKYVINCCSKCSWWLGVIGAAMFRVSCLLSCRHNFTELPKAHCDYSALWSWDFTRTPSPLQDFNHSIPHCMILYDLSFVVLSFLCQSLAVGHDCSACLVCLCGCFWTSVMAILVVAVLVCSCFGQDPTVFSFQMLVVCSASMQIMSEYIYMQLK